MSKWIFVVFVCIFAFGNAQNCKPSITTASGSNAPAEICSGDLILDETFDDLDKDLWKPEVNFWGGGNGEFEWYVSDNENSFARNGKLHIKPTLTVNRIDPYVLEHGHIHLDDCTGPYKFEDSCERQAGGNVIINPIRSARITTKDSFSFKFGRVEVVAKTPIGDWMWPAIWFLPTQNTYGDWTGEIDLLESRGNRAYVKDMESTLHFGQLADADKLKSVSFEKHDDNGFNTDFHTYGLVWDENGIQFLFDGTELGSVPVQDGYWQQGGFEGTNAWESGTKMAPFDQEFHFLINLAVGGTGGFFPDGEPGKPWNNTSPSAMKDFWKNRRQWLPTWRNMEKSSLIVDSVKVWAI